MQPDPTRIFAMASIFQESAVLFAASDLGVFGSLARFGEATAEELANQLNLDCRAVGLLLNACVAVGLLEKREEQFRNTVESAAFLAPGGDLATGLLYMRDVYPAWGRLTNFAKTGKPVESPALHLGDDEARTRNFVLSMHGKALATAPPILAKLKLEGRRQLLDIGGGPGTFSVLLARRYPELCATVLDLPPVVRIAEELIIQQDAADRVRTLAGDYHVTPFPGGNDVALLFGMLHQESAEKIQSILAKTYAALAPGGLGYVMDMMTDPTHTAPKFSALFAVNMALTATSGWVFSSAELTSWMEAAGFAEISINPLPPPIPHWLAGARKPG